MKDMKKFIAFFLLCYVGVGLTWAQQTESKESKVKEAVIVFEKTTHDFGTFSEDNPIVTCSFVFTNEGTAPLVIHQAIASCGCTVPVYPRMPIKPGEKGTMEITYNGSGKYPGRFKKSITVRTNSKDPLVKLYVSGVMTASEKEEEKQ